jgi:DNA polymerase-3 subunit epsilon
VFDYAAGVLVDETFVVVDLETTGASPFTDAVTEIGALKLRGGELLGTLETLVNPGVPIPPMVTMLTGITEAMVRPAPAIGEVLPAWLEFVRDAVIVGHNVRFDCGFLDAALVMHGYAPMRNAQVDTLALARRLVADEVPNLQLHTLAQHFATEATPVHRAFADASATGEVLHALFERLAGFSVFALEELLAFAARPPRASAEYVYGRPARRRRHSTVFYDAR